jgi:hypothetical protein
MSELDDAKLNELIQSRVAIENGDSGWMVALVLMRMLPILKENGAALRRIENAICEDDLQGHSVSHRLTALQDLHYIELHMRKLVEGK